jgi:hypothetical protein
MQKEKKIELTSESNISNAFENTTSIQTKNLAFEGQVRGQRYSEKSRILKQALRKVKNQSPCTGLAQRYTHLLERY